MSKGGPTIEEFDKLLRWLDPDRDKAGEKYEKIRLRLIKIFSARGCYDAEDLAYKAINVVARKVDWLLENYQGDQALYFYGIAKKLYLETLKPRPALPPPDPDRSDLDEVCGYLDECLDELPAAEKELVLRYQEGEKQERIQNRKRIADELKISRNALNKSVSYPFTA